MPSAKILPDGTPLRHCDADSPVADLNGRIEDHWDKKSTPLWAAFNQKNDAKVIDENALATVKANSMVRQTYAGGYVSSVRIQKGPTAEEHNRVAGAEVALDFHSPTAGPEPVAAVRLKLHANAAPPASELSQSEIRDTLGPIINFWTSCLTHVEVWAAFVMLATYLQIVKPMVIDVASAQVLSDRYGQAPYRDRQNRPSRHPFRWSTRGTEVGSAHPTWLDLLDRPGGDR